MYLQYQMKKRQSKQLKFQVFTIAMYKSLTSGQHLQSARYLGRCPLFCLLERRLVGLGKVSTGDVEGTDVSCSGVVSSTMVVLIADSSTSGTTDCSLAVGFAWLVSAGCKFSTSALVRDCCSCSKVVAGISSSSTSISKRCVELVGRYEGTRKHSLFLTRYVRALNCVSVNFLTLHQSCSTFTTRYLSRHFPFSLSALRQRSPTSISAIGSGGHFAFDLALAV